MMTSNSASSRSSRSTQRSRASSSVANSPPPASPGKSTSRPDWLGQARSTGFSVRRQTSITAGSVARPSR
ncbi:hypothetical protein SFUMM280S_07540 [Streptomyces fumanus]